MNVSQKKIVTGMKTTSLAILGAVGGAAVGAFASLKNGTPVLHGMAVGGAAGLTGALTYSSCYAVTGKPLISYLAAGLISGVGIGAMVGFASGHEMITRETSQFLSQYVGDIATFAPTAAVASTFIDKFKQNSPSPPTTKPRFRGRQFPSLSC